MDVTDKDIVVKWGGEEYVITINTDEPVGSFKRRLGELTRVLPKRQKIVGLKGPDGKPASDDCLVGDLQLKAGQRVMMIGAPEEAIAQASADGASAGSEIVDDFQMDEGLFEEIEPSRDPDVLAKLERRMKVDVKVLNEPRRGKKLLVVDIDYTIFDLGSVAEQPMELARPHLHSFFASAYQDYDIVIWSANSLKWMQARMHVKMRALGVLGHEDYKIAFMLDFRSMVTVHTQKRGLYDCKPLAVLWRKFGNWYNESNTIMLDDLRRNYIMNKQNGLVIRPFQKAHKNRASDRELVRLKFYLRCIAGLDTLHSLDHRRWERYLAGHISTEEQASMDADLRDP